MTYRQKSTFSKGLVLISSLFIVVAGFLFFLTPQKALAQVDTSTNIVPNTLSDNPSSAPPAATPKKRKKKKKLPLGNKQSYRSLSPYKPPEPDPVKSVTSLPKKEREKVIALKEKLDKDPENIKLRKFFAKNLYRYELYTMCQNTLEPYIDLIGKSYKLLLAKCHEKRKDFTKLVRLLEAVLFEFPSEYKVLTWAGKTYYTLRDADNAVIKLRGAIDINPKYRPAYEILISLFQETLNFYEARRLVEAMIENFGPRREYLNMLCQLYSKETYFSETIDICKKAARRDKSNPNNRIFMAIAMREAGDEVKAKKIILSTAQKFDDSEFAQWAAGIIYYDLPNYAVSTRYFRKAVKADPKSARSHLGLGKSLIKQEQYKEALVHFIKSCSFDKNSQEEFRIATATVRQKRKILLAREYDLALDKCKKNQL